MGRWASERLGNLCTIETGRKDVNQGNANGKYPFFTCAKDHTYSEEYSFDGEAILIAGNGDVGNVNYYDGKFEAYQRTYVLMSFERILPKYLRFVLDGTLRLALHDKILGNTIPYIRKGVLTDFPIPLPPLPDQKRIASILDKADALRTKRRESITELDTLIQSVFIDMFGDPVTNPKGWEEVSSLGEIADIRSGITKGRKLNGQKTREVPYLAVVNVQDRHLVLNSVKVIMATEAEIEKYRLVENDLLLTEGGDRDKLGRGTLWNNELQECIHQNHIFRVRLSHLSWHPVYLSWLIGSERGKQYFLREAKQTTGIASINLTQLKRFPMLSPPLSLQNRFASIVESIEKQKAAQRTQLSEFENLFGSLQHNAFNGTL